MLAHASKVDSGRVEAAFVVASVLGGLWLHHHVAFLIGPYLVEDPYPLYGVIVGLQGSLLGFVLAALTIVLGYANSAQLQLVRDAGQLPNLFRVYMAGIRAHALATVTSLIALLLRGDAGVVSDLMVWLVAATCILGLGRLLRTLWATREVVQQVGHDSSRSPGQP